jgi:phage replication-related protein YjqB (UPF0714/DUF867 family)
MTDKYASFAELARHEVHGADYRVQVIDRPRARALVVAPHGGAIEIGTSELAASIAGAEHSLFTFEGLKPYGQNRGLHITSHCFDHPECLRLAARSPLTLAVHGCKGEARVYVGGLDCELTALLTEQLAAAGFPASLADHPYPGRNPLNICNRGARGCGAQLEITRDLRAYPARERLAGAVRAAISEHLERLV